MLGISELSAISRNLRRIAEIIMSSERLGALSFERPEKCARLARGTARVGLSNRVRNTRASPVRPSFAVVCSASFSGRRSEAEGEIKDLAPFAAGFLSKRIDGAGAYLDPASIRRHAVDRPVEQNQDVIAGHDCMSRDDIDWQTGGEKVREGYSDGVTATKDVAAAKVERGVRRIARDEGFVLSGVEPRLEDAREVGRFIRSLVMVFSV